MPGRSPRRRRWYPPSGIQPFPRPHSELPRASGIGKRPAPWRTGLSLGRRRPCGWERDRGGRGEQSPAGDSVLRGKFIQAGCALKLRGDNAPSSIFHLRLILTLLTCDSSTEGTFYVWTFKFTRHVAARWWNCGNGSAKRGYAQGSWPARWNEGHADGHGRHVGT